MHSHTVVYIYINTLMSKNNLTENNLLTNFVVDETLIKNTLCQFDH